MIYFEDNQDDAPQTQINQFRILPNLLNPSPEPNYENLKAKVTFDKFFSNQNTNDQSNDENGSDPYVEEQNVNDPFNKDSDYKIISFSPYDNKILKLGQFSESISKMFSEKICEIRKNTPLLKNFLYAPIPDFVKFDFQIKRIKNRLSTSFFCYLDKNVIMATEMQRSLKGTKYQISMNEDFLSDIETQDFYLGEMLSDHNSNKFSLKDDGKFKENQQQKVYSRNMGTILLSRDLFSQRKYNFYLPKIISNSMSIIEENNFTADLSKIKRFQNNIDEYSSVKLRKQEKMMIEDYGQSIAWQKTLVMVDSESSNKNIKFILTKSKSDNYKMIVSSGLNPLQAFCLAITALI